MKAPILQSLADATIKAFLIPKLNGEIGFLITSAVTILQWYINFLCLQHCDKILVNKLTIDVIVYEYATYQFVADYTH